MHTDVFSLLTFNQLESTYDWLSYSSPLALFIYVVLFVLSILTWATIIRKVLELRAEKKQSNKFKRTFSEHEGNIIALSQEGILPSNASARLFVAAYEELRIWATLDRERNCIVADRPVVPALERTLDRAIELETERLESGTTLLATIASVSPLLGLLGTVGGVYLSFINMGNQDNASLQTVGPGLAEALLTTIVGLLVAIPAVFAYNGILRLVRNNENQLYSFANEIVNRFDRQIVVDQNHQVMAQKGPTIRRKSRATS